MQKIGREKQHRFIPYPHGEAEIERDGAAMHIRLSYGGAYGMGEKYDFFNQKGNTVVNRVEEKFCFQGEKTYCAAPFSGQTPASGCMWTAARPQAFLSGKGRSA